MVVVTARRQSREVLLGKAVAQAGISWAQRCMIDVRAQGRTVSGGWPGTRSEARHLVGQQVALIGSRPSHDELEQLVTEAYSRARDTWLACASTQRDPTEPEL